MSADSALPLTVTNVILGSLVIVFVLYVFSEPVVEVLSRMRKRRGYEAELDRDMEEMFPHRAGAAVAPAPARPRLFRRLALALRSAFRRR